MLIAAPAFANCPAVVSDCPSPTFNNLTIGGAFNPASISTGAITATGAATLSGGGTLTGTYAGNHTLSGNVTLTGNFTFGQAANSNALQIFSATDTGQKGIRLVGNGNERWRLMSTGANSGSNAGDNLILQNYNDAGSQLSTVFTITRSTGAMQYNGPMTVGTTEAPQLAVLQNYFNAQLTVTGGWGSISPFKTGIAQSGGYAYTPVPQWVTATVYAAGAFASNGGAYYQTVAGGTSGASAPTCTSGTCSDGAVTWTFVNFLVASNQLIGATNQAVATANLGGNSSDPIGNVFGLNVWGSCEGAATFLNGCLGQETDIGIKGTASALSRIGEQIVILPSYTTQGSQNDIAWRITSSGFNAAGFKNLMVWGAPVGGSSSGAAVIDPNGYGLQVSSVGSGPQDFLNGAGALDLREFNANGSGAFGGGFILRTPNGSWNNDGSIQFGNGVLKTTGTGASFDAGQFTVTAAVVHAAGGGTGWLNSCTSLFARGTDGTVLQVTGVSGGAVTTLSVAKAGWANAAPANPITFTPDAFCGTGANGEAIMPSTFTADLTWAQANSGNPLISINTTGGNTIIGKASALSTSAANGFLQIATMAGAPTGTVGALGAAAVVIDTTNKKLCYSTGGGTWECSAAFTP